MIDVQRWRQQRRPYAVALLLGACACLMSPALAACNCGNDCAAGSYWQNNSLTCTPCAAGRYADETGSTTCSLCPAMSDHLNPKYNVHRLRTTNANCRHSCLIPSESPVLCNAGNYSMPGQIACTTCPAGFSCTGISEPTLCINGTFSPEGMCV